MSLVSRSEEVLADTVLEMLGSTAAAGPQQAPSGHIAKKLTAICLRPA